MNDLTPLQANLAEKITETSQHVHVDAQGRAYLMDGTPVLPVTLKSMIRKGVLQEKGYDLFGHPIVFGISQPRSDAR